MTAASDPQRWRRLSQLFDELLDLEAPARAELLDAQCAGDPQMREDLERMLAADAVPHSFDDGAAGALDLSRFGSGTEDADVRDSIGLRLGAWRIDGVLGRGGMGTVYAAHRDDGDTLQRAAIKRLHRRWDGSLQAQRFLQERRILAALSHRHIPRLLDHGLDDDGRPWLALEFVDGRTLVEWADANRLALAARIDLFRDVCAAVQHAHERFVVHRDLKPANILVDAEGHPKVLDFGVAKRIDDAPGATRTGAFAGFTPEYAAPEQISGGVISAATDVYALGVVLYQLLTGQLPYHFDQDNLRDAAEAITSRSAERLENALTTGTPEEVASRLAHRETSPAAFRRFVRGDLTRIVQTALAKEPERRYASVQAFSDDLKRLLEGRTVSVGGDTFAYRSRKFVRRNRGGMAMAAIAVLAALSGLTGILLQTREAHQQAARAESVKDFALQLLADTNPSNAGFGGDPKRVLKHTSEQLVPRFAGQPELLAETADVLASAMSDLGEKAASERLLRSVLVALKDGKPRAPAWATARIRTRLSEETLNRGEPAETDLLLHQAIAALPETNARNARVLADAWQVRAYLRVSQGNEKEGMEAARRASAIAHRWLGARSRETVHADQSVLVLLATTDAGKVAQAPAEGSQILAATRDFYGKDHPVTRRAMKFMAMIEQAHGHYSRAEALYRELLAAPDNENAAPMLHQELGSLYEDDDRFAQAQAEYERSLALHAKRTDPDNHVLSAARNNLAFAFYRQGAWTQAEAYFRRAGDDWQRIHGSADHPYVLSARSRQADSLVESGRLPDAAALLSDLMPRLQAHDADFYPIALAVRAKLRLAEGRPQQAVRDAGAALDAAPRGDLSPRSQAALQLVHARALAANGDPRGAVAAADRASVLLGTADPWRNPEMARVITVKLGLQQAPAARAQLCALRAIADKQPDERDAPFQRPLRAALQRCGDAGA